MSESDSNETQVTQDPRVARSVARLLDAATELLIEGGARAVTVDAIAERSGVAKSTMYRHFPSRTALIVAVLRHNMPEVDFEMSQGSFEESLRALVGGVAKSMSDPHWARILPALMSLKQTISDVDELTEEDRSERRARLQEVLDQGVAEGLIDPGTDCDTTLHLLVGPLFIATVNQDLARLPALAEEIVDRYLASCRAHARI
ncbi:MAG: TetR/AcrR family transcriptional regulator [Microthrixaceae bacterium]